MDCEKDGQAMISRTQKRYFINFCFRNILYLFTFITIIPLFLIFGYILNQGLGSLNFEFFTTLPKPVGEEGGGIINAILGTLLLVLMASVMALPFGISSGIYLSEYRGSKTSYLLGLAMDILNGVPSIVIGILAYTWVVVPMGHFSAFAGSVALAVMMIPVVSRGTEETLFLLPRSLKEASLALGATYSSTILKIVLPAGLSGIVTGIILSVSRIAGETAPLLFTAFGNPFVNLDPTKPMHSIPMLIYTYAISPFEEWHRLAWGAACVLLITILGLNLLARYLSRKWRWY
jgi:phosphate transport system permease protein